MTIKKFSIQNYFQISIILLSFLAFYQDFFFGCIYFINISVLIYFSSRKGEKGIILFFICIFIYFFYLLRPLYLWGNEFKYSFKFINSLAHNDHYYALIEIFIFSLISLSMLNICMGSANIKKNFTTNNLFYSFKTIFFLIIVKIICKNLIPENLFFYLKIILPFNLLEFIALVILLLYWRYLNLFRRTLFISLILVFLLFGIIEGSKGVFLGVALCVLIVQMLKGNYYNNNFIKFNSIIFYSFLIVFIIISFYTAWLIRSYSGTEEFTYKIFLNLLDNHNFSEIFLDRITSRFNGYDGILVSRYISNDPNLSYISDQLSPLNSIKITIGKFIPNYQLLNYSFANIVSKEIIGHGSSTNSGGAIGLYGILRLKSVLLCILSLLVFFGLIGIFYRNILRRFTNDIGMHYIICVIFIFNLASTINSGNLDNNFFSIIISIYHFLFFYLMVYLSKKKVKLS